MATVTRGEIRAFDPEARELVQAFHNAGWRSYLSQNGHAIMYAPDGETTASVSGHSKGTRSRQARADLDRWLRRNRKRRKPLHRTIPARSFENNPEPEHTPEQENPMSTSTTTTTYACPDCPDREPFVSGGALALHRQRTHDGLTCPECKERFTGGGMSERYRDHRLEKHGVEPKSKTLHVRPIDGVYHCPWCGVPFGSLGGLAGHTKVHKGQPRPAVTPDPPSANGKTTAASPPVPEGVDCPVCGAHFASANGLNGHKKVHRVTNQDQEQEQAAPTPTGSVDLDAWIAGQDAADLLTQVLAVLAPPLVGQIERLRRERDDLKREVAELREAANDHDARMAILREAVNL